MKVLCLKRNKVCVCTEVFSNEFVLRAMNHFHNKYVAFLSSLLDKEKNRKLPLHKIHQLNCFFCTF